MIIVIPDLDDAKWSVQCGEANPVQEMVASHQPADPAEAQSFRKNLQAALQHIYDDARNMCGPPPAGWPHQDKTDAELGFAYRQMLDLAKFPHLDVDFTTGNINLKKESK